MAKRRKQIAMSAEEQAAYLESGRTLQFATVGHDGYPHLTALWYAVLDGKIYFNTYGTSQKSLNMERDPRVTCMIESGAEYAQLKGLVVQGRVQVVNDPDVLRTFADEITRRYPTRRGAESKGAAEERNASANGRFAASGISTRSPRRRSTPGTTASFRPASIDVPGIYPACLHRSSLVDEDDLLAGHRHAMIFL